MTGTIQVIFMSNENAFIAIAVFNVSKKICISLLESIKICSQKCGLSPKTKIIMNFKPQIIGGFERLHKIKLK